MPRRAPQGLWTPPAGVLASEALREISRHPMCPEISRHLPWREAPATDKLHSILTPDWARAHWRWRRHRDGRITWHHIVPAIFTPTVGGALGMTVATTADPNTLTNFNNSASDGTYTLMTSAGTYRSASPNRTISSVIFNATGNLAAAATETYTASSFMITALWYLHGAAVTTASIVVDFSGAPTNSGIAAYWVSGLANAAPEATATFGDNASTATFAQNITTVSSGAFIAVAAQSWSSTALTANSPTTMAVADTPTSSHNLAIGYQQAAGAGAYTTTWNRSTGSDEGMLAIAAFAAAGGGGVAAARGAPIFYA
jgi:hypothetical protein